MRVPRPKRELGRKVRFNKYCLEERQHAVVCVGRRRGIVLQRVNIPIDHHVAIRRVVEFVIGVGIDVNRPRRTRIEGAR